MHPLTIIILIKKKLNVILNYFEVTSTIYISELKTASFEGYCLTPCHSTIRSLSEIGEIFKEDKNT